MTGQPRIRIRRITSGVVPEASILNRRIVPGSPLLLATLDIEWNSRDPADAVGRLEEKLLSFSPSFKRHECRGPRAYHVVPADGRGGAADGVPELEGPLALAHLIEHATIDFLCYVLALGRCSGVTAALRDPPWRFELMIECPDPPAGRCCLALAVLWVSAAVAGTDLGPAERDILAATRLAHLRPGEALTPPGTARALGCSERQAERALATLCDVGYLDRPSYTVNFSGLPTYRTVLS